MEQDIAAQVVGIGGASDFTLWSLFLRADFVVKFVIILLIASSIFSWALIFDKFKLFNTINKSTEDFEKKFLELMNLKYRKTLDTIKDGKLTDDVISTIEKVGSEISSSYE